MANRKKTTLSPDEQLALFVRTMLLRKGRSRPQNNIPDDPFLLPLSERISLLLGIFKNPSSSSHLMHLIMYDIENNKVRTQIAKYLIKKGCIRIQKSVYILSSSPEVVREISQGIRNVQNLYDNNDSVILMPIDRDVLGKSEFIGKDIYLNYLSDPNTTLFF